MNGYIRHGFNHKVHHDLGARVGIDVYGDVRIGTGVTVCPPVDFNANDAIIDIGSNCDIAAFVTISCADSHRRCLGLSKDVERRNIVIQDHVFIGQGATILGGCVIGHHSVIGAGVVLKGEVIEPWSRVSLQKPNIEGGFYFRGKTIGTVTTRCHACGSQVSMGTR